MIFGLWDDANVVHILNEFEFFIRLGEPLAQRATIKVPSESKNMQT